VNGDCDKGLFCDAEMDLSVTIDNLPGGAAKLSRSAFPGGTCTPIPAGPYDMTGATSCDPTLAPDAQRCGPTGACVLVDGFAETIVGCRPRCVPSATKSGCDRSGYTCSFEVEACVEGCQSDEECRLIVVDNNNDGMADSAMYDDKSRSVCDTDTFRCTHPGTASGVTADPCVRQDDCEPDGQCIDPLSSVVGLDFPGGYCTKVGCDVKGRECAGDGAVCARLRPWSNVSIGPLVCLQSCAVGAEPEADRMGVKGHAKGCREGYRCHYNGTSGTDNGVCVGGNYNAVTTSNLGVTCASNSECYSPYGLGGCLTLSVNGMAPATGMCTVTDCAAPGIPADICGKNGVCHALSGDQTFCAQNCTTAADCPASYACADDDNDPSTSRICYAACRADADCRAGQETCEIATGATAGQCVASSR
jgi:hypothetical protein